MSKPHWVLVPTRIVTAVWAAITLVVLANFSDLLPLPDVAQSAMHFMASAAVVVLIAQHLRKDPPLPGTHRKDQP